MGDGKSDVNVSITGCCFTFEMKAIGLDFRWRGGQAMRRGRGSDGVLHRDMSNGRVWLPVSRRLHLSVPEDVLGVDVARDS